jgi:hypothetical protein
VGILRPWGVGLGLGGAGGGLRFGVEAVGTLGASVFGNKAEGFSRPQRDQLLRAKPEGCVARSQPSAPLLEDNLDERSETGCNALAQENVEDVSCAPEGTRL